MAENKQVDPRHNHRQRVRNDYLLHGLEDYEPHRVLELLLFYAIPRKDTKPIAYRLMQKFDTLKEVFDAPIEQLVSVEGISDNAAIFLKIISDVTKRYYIESTRTSKPLRTAREIAEYLHPRFLGEPSECVYLLTFDSNMRPISCTKIFQGFSSLETPFNVKQIMIEASTSAYKIFVLAHNHPDGHNVNPSRADEIMTAEASQALTMIGKELKDHIIISGDKFFSIKEQFGDNLFKRMVRVNSKKV